MANKIIEDRLIFIQKEPMREKIVDVRRVSL